MDDSTRLYYSSNWKVKRLILKAEVPPTAKWIKRAKLPPCSITEYAELSRRMTANIRTALEKKIKGILDGTEDVLS